jgi:hypothetical protein
MHREFENMPTAFSRSDIACIQVLLNLIAILIIGKTNSGAVMTFEDIFGNVLARRIRNTYFSIDMTIMPKKKRLVQCLKKRT